MSDDEERQKKRIRIRNHIAKDLRSPIFRQRVKQHKKEDDAERRYRRYKDVRDLGVAED